MASNNFITPAKAARGLGSAKSGTLTHIRQLVSAIALIFLVPWFVYSVICAMGGDMADAQAWVGKPWNAVLLVLTAGAAFYHMRIGMQIIVEDYIAKTGTKSALLILNSFACIALFVTVALSVLKIWIGAGA